MKPLCIDLFAGLGGFSEGFLDAGYRCVGFDIERHQYGEQKYPGQLVIQDVLTIHGSQFKDATVIVASPPCQNYSYLAMPWSRSTDIVRPCGDGWEVLNSAAAKEMREEWEREGPDNRLFDACFRIQREAIEATGIDCPACFGGGMRGGHKGVGVVCPRCNGTCWVTRHIPLIVENVRGANEWVSPKSTYNWGSFHLWGDVPAIMPIQRAKASKTGQNGSWFKERNGVALPGIRHEDRGTKIGGDWFSDPQSTCRKHGSRSKARKAASATIAKIPLPLSQHIAQVYYPKSALEKSA